LCADAALPPFVEVIMHLFEAKRKIRAFLKDVTYKPNYKFELVDSPDLDVLLIRLEVITADSDNPKVTTKVTSDIKIPIWELVDDRWQEFFSHQLYVMIVDFEHHEINEWFKIKGNHYREPHHAPPSKRHEHDH